MKVSKICVPSGCSIKKNKQLITQFFLNRNMQKKPNSKPGETEKLDTLMYDGCEQLQYGKNAPSLCVNVIAADLD